MLEEYFEALRIALGFLTVLPTGEDRLASPEEMERAFSLFPLVGLGMGVDLTIVGWLSEKVASPLLAASALLVFWVLVTGGLHLDGVADSFDALALGRSKEDRLRIMKESTIGTFGVLAVVLLMMVKMAALTTLVQKGAWRGLLLAPMVARWAAVLLAHISTPAREGGLGGMAIEASTKKTTLVGLAITVAGLLIFWPLGLMNLLWVYLLVKGVSRFWEGKIGGITGDTLGATIEVVEMGILVVATLF